VLFFLVYIEADPRLFTLILEGFTLSSEGLSPRSVNPVSITPETGPSALLRRPAPFNSFRIRTYKSKGLKVPSNHTLTKKVGGGRKLDRETGTVKSRPALQIVLIRQPAAFAEVSW
jgi:hypothetical protein